MIVAAALILLVGGAPLLPPPPMAVAVVPEEPQALMLPEAVTYQAVVADVDGDEVGDVVRMIATGDGGIDVEAWRFAAPEGWEPVSAPVTAVPSRSAAEPGQLVYADAPARLIVRRIGGVERATLARQPRFEEPGLEVECCLLLHDVVVEDGQLQLVAVTDQMPDADAVLAIDMDGDSTDEVLVTRGLPPLGDTTFPTRANVLRWTEGGFLPPVLTTLSIGSGFSPFILGDSDGFPGDEAAFIGAQDRLHRVSLRDGDLLVAEAGHTTMLEAIAVPDGAGRAIATISRLSGLEVRPWARDAPPGETIGSHPGDLYGLLGVVATLHGTPQLALRTASGSFARLTLPALDEVAEIPPTAAAQNAGSAGLYPFAGWLPGSGFQGDPWLILDGNRVTVSGARGFTSALAGVVPVGLAGPELAWVALLHGAGSQRPLDHAGGRLDIPASQAGSGVSIVPFTDILQLEEDDGSLDPPIDGAIGEGRALIVGGGGFGVSVDAPPGSRVYVHSEGEVTPTIHLVPPTGFVRVVIRQPDESGPTFGPALIVVTPSGRTYTAEWDVVVLDEPPGLDARAQTSVGSPSVVISGETAPLTVVTVRGRDVTVDAEGRFSTPVDLPPWPTEVELVATDRIGNESRTTIVGVGWFDYRALPWTAIAIVIVGIAGAILSLRVPDGRERPRPADEDGVLEELDPEG